VVSSLHFYFGGTSIQDVADAKNKNGQPKLLRDHIVLFHAIHITGTVSPIILLPHFKNFSFIKKCSSSIFGLIFVKKNDSVKSK